MTTPGGNVADKSAVEDSYVTIKLTTWALSPDHDEHEDKLAHLLAENVVGINNGWWDEKWPQDRITFHVNCNDVFAWGCADAEELLFGEIPELYSMWTKDNGFGPAAWCIKKRKMMPQKPVEDHFRKDGIWSLEDLLNKAEVR